MCLNIDDVKDMVNTQWTAGTRRRVAKILYYNELQTILRDEPLLPSGTEVTILKVYKGNDRGGDSGVKRRLPDQEATMPSAKRQAVSGSESKPEPAKAGTSVAEVIDLSSDSDDGDGDSDAAKKDRFSDPDYEYNSNPGARARFRYFRIDDHPGEWPGPDVGMRFDVDRYRRDLGWPDQDVREVFRDEFADGGKDLYADHWANLDVGLARDNVEWGWQLAHRDKCELIRNLPLVENVTFVKHDNFCGKRGIAAGTCYWTAMATHLYGDARHWLRVKAEHLEHFGRVLENKDHPRHQLYRELNQKWYPAVGTPGPGTPAKGKEKGRWLLVNLWQVLNLPGVYTPMSILDVSADLYGLYLVVYSHHLPPEHGQEEGPYEDKVYKVAARGAYNARHLGLIFENGNHFQPIIPNDYIHWEFKFPRFTQESTSGLPSTGKTEGVRHPWRSEFGQHDKKIGGQQAPALLDHGFDPTVAAMAVGYPPPRGPADNRGDDDQGGDDAPWPGRKGGHGGGDGRGGNSGGKGGPGNKGPGDKGSGGGQTKDDDDDNDNDNNNNDAPATKAAKESHKRPVTKANEEPNRRLPVLASPTNSEQRFNVPIQNPPPENHPDYFSKDADDDDAEAKVKSGSGSKSGKEAEKLTQGVGRLEADIAQRDQLFSDQVKRTRLEYEENISKMKLEHDAEIKKLEREHDAEFEKLDNEHKAEVNKWRQFAKEKDAKSSKETHEVKKDAREAIKKLTEEKEKAEQEKKKLREEIKQLRAEQSESAKEPPAEEEERDKPEEVEPEAEKEAEGEQDGVKKKSAAKPGKKELKKETAAPAAKNTKVGEKRKSPETEEVEEEPKPKRPRPAPKEKTKVAAGKEDTQPDAPKGSQPAIGDEGSGLRRSGRVRKQVKRYGQE